MAAHGQLTVPLGYGRRPHLDGTGESLNDVF